mgnify:CR=1 FL=1
MSFGKLYQISLEDIKDLPEDQYTVDYALPELYVGNLTGNKSYFYTQENADSCL